MIGWRGRLPVRLLLARTIQALALLGAILILGFYAQRVAMPLPLYAWDEGGFAIRALFSQESIARNPFVPVHSNGAFLWLIRAVRAVTSDYLPALRVVNVALYFGGILAVAAAVKASPPRRTAWLLVAIAFPYYRFVVTGLPEAAYVGVLGCLGLATAILYRRRPLAHGLVAGTAAAILVLIKPHGLAVIAGLLAVGLLDLLASRGWRQAPVRVLSFAAAFFCVGNAIQWATGQPVDSSLKFFLEDFYSASLGAGLIPGAVTLGALSLFAMASAVVLLAGIPLAFGAVDIARRWRRERAAFRFSGEHLLFLLLALSLVATICMVAIFAAKMASAPTETKRLWGRYFEFFAPLIWLAASGALDRAEPLASLRGRLACALIPLAGLAGLMFSFRAGVVLFPWDATAMTAFFRADPDRAAFGEIIPYRHLAVIATLACAAGIALGARLSRVWLPYFVALGLLSTVFDATSMDPMVRQHNELAEDFRTVNRVVGARPGATLALVRDENDGDMTFMGVNGHPEVRIWTPAAVTPPALTAVQTLITVRVDEPPAGAWTRTFRGKQVAIYERRSAK